MINCVLMCGGKGSRLNTNSKVKSRKTPLRIEEQITDRVYDRGDTKFKKEL